MMNYHPASYYLPHQTPMVMVENIHLINEEKCICSVRTHETGILAPFLNEDKLLPNFYAIEIMAQTIGVWNGYHSLLNNKIPSLGMLIGGRAIKTTLPAFPYDSHLMIHANLVLNDSKLANFDCQIFIDQQCVVKGKLNVYEPDESELEDLFGDNRLGDK